MADQPNDDRARLLSHFSSARTTNEHALKWDELYSPTLNFTPWDKGAPSPALIDFLDATTAPIPLEADIPTWPPIGQHKVLLPHPRNGEGRRLKALVPGCGRGYDVLLLASYGYDAYGLEISANALMDARRIERQKQHSDDEVYRVKSGCERGTVTWLAGDFFEDRFWNSLNGGAKFDLIYDYTFLSALPPVQRPAWSQRMHDLLAPEGRLVCLEFPTYKDPSTAGPPWALPSRVYDAHLPRPGEALPYALTGELVVSRLGPWNKENGLMNIWRSTPPRTHKIGYNASGTVTDRLSVWVHPKKLGSPIQLSS